MSKLKSFKSGALSTLTGAVPGDENIASKEGRADQAVKSAPASKEVQKTSGQGNRSKKARESSSSRTRSKSGGHLDLQDPNKRSTKSKNVPVTFYLNEHNLNKFKEWADKNDQKPSWIVDEIIYEFMSREGGLS